MTLPTLLLIRLVCVPTYEHMYLQFFPTVMTYSHVHAFVLLLLVKNGSQKFKVWVPSLADVALVLMNMGAAFVTLFPFENLQPPFTEGDLL